MSTRNAGNKTLVKANGVIAPQLYDTRKGEWDFVTGEDGAIHFKDMSKSKQFYRMSGEAMPATALEGDVTLIIDTGEVYVYYKNKWRLL